MQIKRLGRYELFAKLGSGGMAEVHLARQRGLKRFRKLVVVKTIHPELARDEHFIDLLLEEARISALLKHPRVVDIYDVDECDGVFFIAMEYLAGQSLTEIIKAGRRGNRLDVMSCAQIIANVAEGLDAAHGLKSHEGEALSLVHRDVSPGNIVVLYSGDVKIVDFGVANAACHLSDQRKVGNLAGKLGYAAPEQLLNLGGVDPRSDIFSLGVVMWEALCLRRLYPAKDRKDAIGLALRADVVCPSMIRSEVPTALDEICLRALAPECSDRFQTAKDMCLAIRQVLTAVGYQRDSETIAHYMNEVFAERRMETEDLIRQISSGTHQFAIVETEDAATTTLDMLLDQEGLQPESPGELATVIDAVSTSDITGVFGFDDPSDTSFVGASPSIQTRRWGWVAVVVVGLFVIAVAVVVGGRSHEDRKKTEVASASVASTEPSMESIVPPPATVGDTQESGSGSGEDEDKRSNLHKERLEKRSRIRDPAKVDSLIRQGMRAVSRGRYSLARQSFFAVLKTDPGNARARRGLALTLQRSGSRKAAIRQFRRYLKQHPNASDVRKIRARLKKLEAE